MAKLFVIVIALACACSKSNPNYCAGAPQHNCSLGDGGPDAPKGCTTTAECAGTATPVCDLNKHVCVQCNTADYNVCMGTATPICDLTNEVCRACTTHAECGAPGACLPDGSCGTDASVAWVMPGGNDTGSCTQSMPCGSIGHALLQNRPFIKLATGSYSEQPTIQQNVTILADAGAKLLGVVVGPMVTIKGTNSVAIYDLAITQGPGATGDGIVVGPSDAPTVHLDHVTLSGNNAHGAYFLGGSLTMTGCTVIANSLGGINFSGVSFDITNTFVVRNGSVTSAAGGVSLAASQPGNSRFAFNTVVDNSVQQTSISSGGVTCDIGSFNAPNNILARNYVNGVTTATNSNHMGSCMYPSSVDQTSVAGLNFVSPDSGPYNYHLLAGSLAIDQATTAMAVDVDVDGDTRPQGAQKDQGADEYK